MISKSNHAKFERFVCLAVSEGPKTWLPFFFRSKYSKTLDSVFCDIQINQGLGENYERQPLALADNPNLDLGYSEYRKYTHPIIAQN